MSKKTPQQPRYFEGRGGAKCSHHNILAATSAYNSLEDDIGWGSQISAGVASATLTIPFACAAPFIIGPYKDPLTKSLDNQLSSATSSHSPNVLPITPNVIPITPTSLRSKNPFGSPSVIRSNLNKSTIECRGKDTSKLQPSLIFHKGQEK